MTLTSFPSIVIAYTSKAWFTVKGVGILVPFRKNSIPDADACIFRRWAKRVTFGVKVCTPGTVMFVAGNVNVNARRSSVSNCAFPACNVGGKKPYHFFTTPITVKGNETVHTPTNGWLS